MGHMEKELSILFIIFIFCSFILNVKETYTDTIAAFYLPQTRFWELLFGSVMAWLTVYNPTGKNKPFNKLHETYKKLFANIPFIRKWRNVQSCVGMLVIGFGFYTISKDVFFQAVGHYYQQLERY